jgi:hypothetical protein
MYGICVEKIPVTNTFLCDKFRINHIIMRMFSHKKCYKINTVRQFQKSYTGNMPVFSGVSMPEAAHRNRPGGTPAHDAGAHCEILVPLPSETLLQNAGTLRMGTKLSCKLQ